MPSKGWHARGYLPHFDSQEIVQFVTYRLADSLPLEALERIRLSDQPESLRDELLDRGWGDCWLRLPEIAARAIRTFWQADYWDRFIRNDAHFESAIGYIDNNPVKAGLARTPADWTWGSARFMR
jgi:hypothetical protein